MLKDGKETMTRIPNIIRNSRHCVECGREFFPTHMNKKICSDSCREVRSRIHHREKWRKSVIFNGELRHEKLLKLFGTPKHQKTPLKKKGGKHTEVNPIKGHTKQEMENQNKKNYETLIGMINMKPYTTGQIYSSKKLVDLNSNPLRKGAIRHYLRNLVSVGLLNQKICRMGSMNDGYSHRHPDSLYEIWLYSKPDLKTPFEQLFYLTKLDVLKRKGIHVCKHTFM